MLNSAGDGSCVEYFTGWCANITCQRPSASKTRRVADLTDVAGRSPLADAVDRREQLANLVHMQPPAFHVSLELL
jgi:hypothetical protein